MTSYDLGKVTVMRGRTLVNGVPVINEIHRERNGRTRTMWYLDPNAMARLNTRATKKLKHVCATQEEVGSLALELKALSR